MASRSKGLRRHIKKYAAKKAARERMEAFAIELARVANMSLLVCDMVCRVMGQAYRWEKIKARLLERRNPGAVNSQRLAQLKDSVEMICAARWGVLLD